MSVTEVSHPLAQHKLGLLRDERTSTADFRRLVNELTLLLTYEATKDLATEQVEISTPLEATSVPRISGKKVAVCPILRAGVGMLDGVLSLVSGARVGFIGMYRDEETLEPHEYYVKLPADVAERDVIVLDPMLATGNSTTAAVDVIKKAGATSDPVDRDHRRARGNRARPGRAPGRGHRRGRRRPRPERARLHRARPRRRRRSPVRHEVIDELRANPEVLYGAGLALLIVVLLTPVVGNVARYLGIVDRPGERRVHERIVPKLGGLALFFGIIIPALAFVEFSDEMRGLLLGAAVATAVGAIDDFRGLLWWQKLAGQVGAAAIPVASGIWVDRFTFPFVGVHELSPWVGKPLTVVWIVAVMNMVNFLDGLDGLAAGVCSIAGGTFAVIALSLGKPEAAIVSAIVFGACLGFLRHNFYPARIFMGDSGAMLLGFVLATVAVEGLLKTAATVALFFPLLVLAVPIMDTGFVVARRLKYGQPITAPDQEHLHHRFLRIGLSQRRTTVVIWLWCATLAGAALATRFIDFREGGAWHLWPTIAVAAIALAAVLFSLAIVYMLEIVKLANPRIRRRAAREQEAAEQRKSA